MKRKQLLALLLIFLSAFTYAQQSHTRVITGSVKDEKGNFLQSITVTEKSTSNAVVTNEKGAFSISVQENSLIEFTGVGFETQTISIRDKSAINFT